MDPDLILATTQRQHIFAYKSIARIRQPMSQQDSEKKNSSCMFMILADLIICNVVFTVPSKTSVRQPQLLKNKKILLMFNVLICLF